MKTLLWVFVVQSLYLSLLLPRNYLEYFLSRDGMPGILLRTRLLISVTDARLHTGCAILQESVSVNVQGRHFFFITAFSFTAAKGEKLTKKAEQ